MGYTLTQKILLSKTDNSNASEGDYVFCDVDLVLGNDITTPPAIAEFERAGFNAVFDNKKIAIVLDHFTPCKDIASATLCKTCRDFAKKHDIVNFFEGGNVGVEHALLPEKGLCRPNDVIIGADSHTCTYGALGLFSTGIGSTDMCAAMQSGKCWFKLPRAIKIELAGNSLPRFVGGKDVILHIISLLGVNGANYASLEFCGEGVKLLDMDARFTICNMAVECGAKNAVFPVDDITVEYVRNACGNNVADGLSPLFGDDDAEYYKTLTVDLDKLRPVVACPSLPSNVLPADDAELKNVRLDQVVIGSCTNGRYSDLEVAARILKGKRVKDGLRLIVAPATPSALKKAVVNGIIDIFIDAGAVITPCSCGCCLGGHLGILAENEVCLSTTNRNFVGRMGHTSSKVYLASPAVAAVSAIYGFICDPEEVGL